MTALYDGDLFTQPTDTAQYITENHLTPRQWSLYRFLKRGVEFKNQEEMLASYDEWCDKDDRYGYYREKENGVHHSNMTSARNMRKDIHALKRDGIIQKVIISGKIAQSYDEAIGYLDREKARALRVLESYWAQVEKLEKDNQTRLVFGQERDHIEALIR